MMRNSGQTHHGFILERDDIVRGSVLGQNEGFNARNDPRIDMWVSQGENGTNLRRSSDGMPGVGVEGVCLSHIAEYDHRHGRFLAVRLCDTGDLEFVVEKVLNIQGVQLHPWSYQVRRTR